MSWRNEFRKRAREWTKAQPIVFEGEIPFGALNKFKKFFYGQIRCEATSTEGLACEEHLNHDGPHKDARGRPFSVLSVAPLPSDEFMKALIKSSIGTLIGGTCGAVIDENPSIGPCRRPEEHEGECSTFVDPGEWADKL